MANKSRIERSPEPLPSYKQPPVDEVVCGFTFEPLCDLKIPHIGLLWQKLRNEYPKVQHAAPIARDSSLLVDDATKLPLPRIWFISKSDNELIQFQLDRFYYNWRHRGDNYPRYQAIVQKFQKATTDLEAFATESMVASIKPLECELTYINHIPKGRGWENIEDLTKLFRDLKWEKQKHQFLPAPRHVAWQVRFEFPEGKGWLNVKLNQGTRKADGVPIFILELSAKGLGEEKSPKAMRAWFDMAHEWIVRGFTDLTATTAQEAIWNREK
jgi:uncharacterized protein (TIGR04255 family)